MPIPAPPTYLLESEREAWIQARTRAGAYCRGLGNAAAEELSLVVREQWVGEDIVREVIPEKRQQRLRIIRESVAEAIAQGWGPQRLASELGDLTGDWSHNWQRIARTELQGAVNEGAVIMAVRHEGPTAGIARVPQPGACGHCRRLFLGPDGRPIVFTAEELVENGANVGRHPRDWRATVWPIHPHCVCPVVPVPRGFSFDADWNLEKI